MIVTDLFMVANTTKIHDYILIEIKRFKSNVKEIYFFVDDSTRVFR